MTRKCSKCNIVKNLDLFYNDKNKPLGKSYLCKSCSKAKKRNNEIRKNYGITQQEYEEILKSQNYECAICGRSDTGIERTNRLSIDHCHDTGKVRGLLCNWCNQGLGMFRDDSSLLDKAISYLKES